MDIIFDIDGTLADLSHRLPLINNPERAKDWENFLNEESVGNDAPIAPTWVILTALLAEQSNRLVFITGRPERLRRATQAWLTEVNCPIRRNASGIWDFTTTSPIIYMRKDGDRRPSHIVKGELLERARKNGYDPAMVFEDRKADAEMWRSKGLLCAHVNEGDF